MSDPIRIVQIAIEPEGESFFATIWAVDRNGAVWFKRRDRDLDGEWGEWEKEKLPERGAIPESPRDPAVESTS